MKKVKCSWNRDDMMLGILSQIILIILLTMVAIVSGANPILLILIVSALLGVMVYHSFFEEQNVYLTVSEIALMLAFCVVSSNFTGFLILFFLKDIKIPFRMGLGMAAFWCISLWSEHNRSLAFHILLSLVLFLMFVVFAFAEIMTRRILERKQQERKKIVLANISEMHEKRLNEQLVMQNRISERNARLVERENISRNIHNSVGHSITAAIMTLDAADMLYEVKPDEARKKMNDANERIRGSLESIRRAVRVLDEENKTLFVRDLKAELGTIASEFMMDTSIEIYCNFHDMEDEVVMPHDYVVFLTSVLQELLTNGVKHGNATEFLVVLFGDSAHVSLKISDNGRSDFNDQNYAQRIEHGFGLKKIVSYVEKVGGCARFKNEQGFQAIIELPIGF